MMNIGNVATAFINTKKAPVRVIVVTKHRQQILQRRIMMNETCSCGGKLELMETDARSEWVEENYECIACDKVYVHRTEYDQVGLVISDKVEEE